MSLPLGLQHLLPLTYSTADQPSPTYRTQTILGLLSHPVSYTKYKMEAIIKVKEKWLGNLFFIEQILAL